jgi:hypothetical protein
MLNQTVENLEMAYAKLSLVKQRQFEAVLLTLDKLIDMEVKHEKDYLKEINKYLSNKIKREKSNGQPLDIFKLKNLIHRKNQYPAVEYREKLETLLWAMLPELSYFEKREHLANFLGNCLRVDLKDDKKIHEKISHQALTTRQQVVESYKNLYQQFESERKHKALHELGRGVFTAATRKELTKFNKIFFKV